MASTRSHVRYGSKADLWHLHQRCLVYPQKQTWNSKAATSANSQERTFAIEKIPQILAMTAPERH